MQSSEIIKGDREMKAFTVMFLAVALATGTAFAAKNSSGSTGGGYFYITVGTDTDSDGDARLVSSAVFSTLAACDTAAASATALVQGCVARCNPASTSAYYMEQKTDSDSDDPSKFLYYPIGPYGFESDCEAGIADASAAGVTDVLSACSVFSSVCKGGH
jgi:hypothetical protein